MVRDEDREITLLRVLAEDSTPVEESRALRDLTRLSEDTVRGKASVSVVQHADPVAAIVEHQQRFDLTILGMQRTRGRSALITEFTRRLAAEGEGPLVMLSQQTF